ncbi:MAG TPA: MFS transporter [Verrucomicrobiae bacterium]|nr:MFS transporter [Verrucomicrobiae bacterium]
MKKGPSVLVIFLTVFIDLIGFGIVVPLIALYSRNFGAGGWMIAVIGASYSAAQFIFAPIWGRLSDRLGRRPILLMSSAGAALSYVLFAIGSGMTNGTVALTLLLISRSFAGACGGNITVAQAYIADITPPENRSKRMGLIGMAFGLGFICGPIIAGIGLKFLGNTGPGWLAAGICALNFLLALFILAESRKPTSEPAKARPHLKQWGHTLSQPKIGLLVFTFFLATFAFSCFEITLPLLINDDFKLNLSMEELHHATTITMLFVYCGLIGAFVQGGATGRLVKLLGESKLIALSLFLTGASLILLPFVKGNGQLLWSHLFNGENGPWIKMLLVLALLAIGSQMTRPPLFGLLSNLTPENEQGATIGVAQGVGSLARVFGPLFAVPLYTHIAFLPYVICGGVSVVAGLIAMAALPARAHVSTTSAPTPAE